MENVQVKTLCQIRDIYRAIAEFETDFQKKFNLCLNEGMLLCSLNNNDYSSSELARTLGLSNSNTSKVIKQVESKGLVRRIIGKDDKRQMYFTLTSAGKEQLASIKCENFKLPELLESVIAQN